DLRRALRSAERLRDRAISLGGRRKTLLSRSSALLRAVTRRDHRRPWPERLWRFPCGVGIADCFLLNLVQRHVGLHLKLARRSPRSSAALVAGIISAPAKQVVRSARGR